MYDMQASAKRAAWEDPVEWIVSTCPWKDSAKFDSSAFQRMRPEDVGCDNMAAASALMSSSNTFIRSGSAEPSDPLVNSSTMPFNYFPSH